MACESHVYLWPKQLNEKVKELHALALGAALTVLAQERADYTGVKVQG